MRVFTKLVRPAAAIVISVALGACGGSTKSPVAPSSGTPGAAPTSPAPTGIVSGATIDGTIVGVSGGTRLGMHGMGAGTSVSVVGTSVSSPIDASGHFALQGVPPGNVQLQVTGAGVSATLTLTGVSDHEQIHITIQVNGSSATADDSDRETTDNQVEVEGKITAITGNVITVAGKNITIPAGTPIHHGGTAATLADLQIGSRVHVHGTKSGTGVTATDVELQTDNPGNPGPPVPPPGNGTNPGDATSQTELNGVLAGRSGTCPALTFTVGTTTVTTNASTKFNDTTCSALANGDKVEVKGTKQSNGTVVASSIEKTGGNGNGSNDNNPGSGQQVNGVVAGRAGTCPALTFTVGTASVATNSSTQFKDTTCSSLANGDKVEVKGTKQSSGVVLAAEVDKQGK